jgi:predicted nucleotidyltransferase
MTTEQHTQPVDLAALTEYFTAQPDVIAVYLFGSRATGRARAESDVDVAVLLNEEDSVERFERRLQLMVEVSEVCGREADVIVLNDAPPILQNQVLKHGRLLYERDRRSRVEFEVLSRKIYFDYKPVLDRQTRELFREIKEVGLGGRRRYHRGTIEAARRVHHGVKRAAGGDFSEVIVSYLESFQTEAEDKD